MQEHIRRAHPDDYLPRLSATKDSFEKMIRAAALHQSSGGIPPMGGSFTGSLGQAPISPSRGRNLALGGAEERTKSANGAWSKFSCNHLELLSLLASFMNRNRLVAAINQKELLIEGLELNFLTLVIFFCSRIRRRI